MSMRDIGDQRVHSVSPALPLRHGPYEWRFPHAHDALRLCDSDDDTAGDRQHNAQSEISDMDTLGASGNEPHSDANGKIRSLRRGGRY